MSERRLPAGLPLLLAALLLLAACAGPPPTTTPTTPPITPSSPPPTAAPAQTLTVPHWLSFQYPAGWFPIAGRAPGFAGVASRDVGILPTNNLTADTALFYAFHDTYPATDPLVAMQEERLQQLSAGIEILDPPVAAAVAGLPAAALRYRFTLDDGEPGVVRLTLVRAPDGRYAELWAISREEHAARYAPLFTQIAATFTFHDMLPAPALAFPAPTSSAFLPYSAPDANIALSHPPGWEALPTAYGLLVHPIAEPNAAQIAIGSLPPDTNAEGTPSDAPAETDTATAFLTTIAQQLLPELIYDAVPISPIATANASANAAGANAGAANAAVARAYYAGTDQGQPRFIVLNAIVRGDQRLYTIAILPAPGPTPPTLLPTVEAILDTITPES